MVGFGSSLRMGRRAGWEAAYLDYETLKLFLSQIESVYEEEGHHNQQRRDVFLGDPDSDEQNGRKRKARRDYRDELFLESDSDAAFASSQSNEDDSSLDASDYENEQQRMESRPPMHNKQGSAQRFTLMGSSSSEESNSADDSGKCGGVPWRTEKTSAMKSKKRRPKPKNRFQGEDDYYKPRETTGPNTFIMDEGSESFDPASKTTHTSSLFNAPFQLGVSSEKSTLLAQPSSPNDSFFRFSQGNMTPPMDRFGTFKGQEVFSTMPTIYGSSVNAFNATQTTSPVGRTTQAAKLEEERRRARRQRRRRRQARQRRDREKRVPEHIRVAHSKARAITERFLGLLRAEIEKITLFTQARLGELADTAGSLRFLSSEELTELNGTFVARATTSTYEHPLSDGGIHPSASSSSDDGAGGKASYPWTDSSSDGSIGSNRLSIPQTFSAGGVSTQTEQIANLASRGDFSRHSSPIKQSMNKQHEQYESATRKIGHFDELRRERPIFQRNDHIVGEDLLLVSAVDEADAYSAVGVELLHILKYICVNVIAVRKICRKHDRLLMNRMLGGYYHRKKTTRPQEERTLGGLIAHVAGDIYEAHPALIGLVNHGKLIGVYDLKIQELADSRTVKVISSCLALALSEYEVSRTRADFLARLNSSANVRKTQNAALPKRTEAPSPFGAFDLTAVEWVKSAKDNLASPCKEVESFDSDDERGSGPPSTESTMSLARLRFTVLSIAALREASRIKLDLFAIYLSRSSLSFTGQAVIGEGLDGCSRETLDFLVCYSPDAALLLEPSALYEGLRRGRWRQLSLASVMRASLAVALRPSFVTPEISFAKTFHEEELVIMNALSILPKSEGIDSSAPLEGTTLPLITSFSISRFVDFPPALLRANRFSHYLYTVNYYIVHPTANTFVIACGANVAYSAAIIGAASFSAMFSAALHCYLLSGHTDAKSVNFNFAPYRRLLIFSSVAAIAGNIVQAHGISQSSVPIAVIGRLLLGFGSADIVHRQFVVAFVPPSLIVAESARLFLLQVMGLISGLLIGSLVQLAPFRVVQYGVHSFQRSNWIMVVLWFIQFCHLLFGGRRTEGTKNKVYQKMKSGDIAEIDYHQAIAVNSYDSSESDPAPGTPARLFHRSPETRARHEIVKEAFVSEIQPTRSIRHTETSSMRRPRRRKVMTLVKRVRRILAYNVAVPVTLALVVSTIFAQELLFTSCALIADRYFGWRGNVAAFFLGCMSVMILPIDFACEQIARRYEERTTIKRAIVLLGLGLLVMVNWGSVFAMVANLKILFTETKDMRHHYYDWLLGMPQYLIGFIITFTGLKALQGASRSLLSKVSPPNSKNLITNIGTIATFVGLFAQFLADVQILTVGLSHRVINTDIVNSLVMPLLFGCLVAYYFVRKHYFFLM